MDMAGRKIDAVILSKFDTVDDKSRGVESGVTRRVTKRIIIYGMDWGLERSDPKGHEAIYYILNGLGFN